MRLVKMSRGKQVPEIPLTRSGLIAIFPNAKYLDCNFIEGNLTEGIDEIKKRRKNVTLLDVLPDIFSIFFWKNDFLKNSCPYSVE